MAFRVDYLLQETGQNLLRNPSLTAASVLTVAVSLSLMGAAMLVQQGVEQVNERFRDGVEFSVWMNVGVDEEHVKVVENFLDNSLFVEDYEYVDQQATYVEFQSYFADLPDILELVSPEEVPTSFRVIPTDTEVSSIQAIGDDIAALAGVREVNYASDTIKAVSNFSRGSSRVMLLASLASALAAALLMYNTIRTAVFARRREIEVMRLVGATKWFIRIPFMLEGLIQGVVGAFLSLFAVAALNRAFAQFIANQNFKTLEDFPLDVWPVMSIGLVLMVVGAILGGAGAAVAVTRYLDT